MFLKLSQAPSLLMILAGSSSLVLYRSCVIEILHLANYFNILILGSTEFDVSASQFHTCG